MPCSPRSPTVDDAALPTWRPSIQWLRSVAHRRKGELDAALSALDVLADQPTSDADMARLRTRWLKGEVEEVVAELPALVERFRNAGDPFNEEGALLELTTKRSWLGDPDLELVVLVGGGDTTNAMVVTAVLAEAAIAVAAGDEAWAAGVLREPALAARSTGLTVWYWR